jgi:hypothetical protein
MPRSISVRTVTVGILWEADTIFQERLMLNYIFDLKNVHISVLDRN